MIVRSRGGWVVVSGLGADHPSTEALGERFPLRVQIQRYEIALSADQVLDALREREPLFAGDLEVATEVEYGALAHPVLGANRFHQAV